LRALLRAGRTHQKLGAQILDHDMRLQLPLAAPPPPPPPPAPAPAPAPMVAPHNTPYPSQIWNTPQPLPGIAASQGANATDNGVNRTANAVEEMKAYMDAYAEAARVKAKLAADKKRATMKVGTTTKPPPEAPPTTIPLTTLPPTTTTTLPPTPKPWNWWDKQSKNKRPLEMQREELKDVAEVYEEAAHTINASAHDLANATKELAINVTIEMSELHDLDLLGTEKAARERMMKKMSQVCGKEWHESGHDGAPICPSAITDVFFCMEKENETQIEPCIMAILPGGGPHLPPLLECGDEHKDEIVQAKAPPPPPED